MWEKIWLRGQGGTNYANVSVRDNPYDVPLTNLADNREGKDPPHAKTM